MNTEDIHALARRHGTEAAHHFWQLDPAEYDMATEWVRNADAGTMQEYDIPGPFDEMPCDLNTDGWDWDDIATYGAAWEAAYLNATTELCRQVISADDMAAANEVRHER